MAEWEWGPLTPLLVPVMVTENVHREVDEDVPTVSVELPEPVMDAGLKVALAPLGSPLTLSPTTSAKPPLGVTVILKEARPPALIFAELGDTESEKSALAGA